MLDKEILDGFREESNQLMEELVEVVEKLEVRSATFPKEHLEQFAQRIDRIMGSAKTMCEMDPSHIGLQKIGKIAELCKRMGYMAADTKNPKVVPLFAAFWADTVDVINDLLVALDNPAKTEALIKSFISVLQGRLEWLAKQVASMAPPSATGTIRMTGSEVDQKAIDAMNMTAPSASKAAPAAKISAAKTEVPDVAAEEGDDDSEIGGESFAALMKDLDLNS